MLRQVIKSKPDSIRGSKHISVAHSGNSVSTNSPGSLSIAQAYQRSHRPLVNQKEKLMKRFFFVCQVLKQLNQEVPVWTEDELRALANTMLDIGAEDKEMIAVLLPQNVVRFEIQKTFAYEHHARLFSQLLQATSQSVQLTYITSNKDSETNRCELNFSYEGRSVTWRFTEAGSQLSLPFLKKACQWISKNTNGQFAVLEADSVRVSLVFIPNAVKNKLKDCTVAV